ncbi:hypothetical protein [Bifidobacterium sp. SO1]|uniref:hypothetical protein n=1 Tax=Bifidobacterium sp. SO1 TaxID=2809029 RepID=UPI001BDDA2E9|nr:hypothetical protein [Bifidobacterium sp. SO1]MBT1162779.1 hypothetical protein [Bifidobacterium sp. SO1]
MGCSRQGRKPKGTPEGGQFDHMIGGPADSDITDPTPANEGPDMRTIMADMTRRLYGDTDTMSDADAVLGRVGRWVEDARLDGDRDDLPLLAAAIRFDPDLTGGSTADMIAAHVGRAFQGHTVTIPDRHALELTARRNILATSIDPDGALQDAGLPSMSYGERFDLFERQHREMLDREEARWRESPEYRRRQSMMRTIRAKTEHRETIEREHVDRLGDGMRALYEENVDKGLQHGSAFDDRIAFADVLRELEREDWNPRAGMAYRKTPGFRRLERELLDGRKPTRLYRLMRDSLCDNETEYRDFMASNPDVFDPDEKVLRPFAGLGGTVGQYAMIRLTARHRGVKDALKLVRRDPSVDIVMGEGHEYWTAHVGDKRTKNGMLPITANGMKPSSIMSWMHNEKPGSREWMMRAERRFTDANGGEWHARADA